MATPVQRQRSNSPKHRAVTFTVAPVWVGVHNHDPAPGHTWSQTGATRPACLAESADAGSLRVPIGISPDGNAEVVFTPWPEGGVRTGLLGPRRSLPLLYIIAPPAPFAQRTALKSISLRRAPRPSPEG